MSVNTKYYPDFLRNSTAPLIKSLHDATTPEEALRLIKDGEEVNKPNARGHTPLHYACWKENVEVARVLLDYGADPCFKTHDDFGKTPLEIACGRSNIPLIQLLIENGAEIDPILSNSENAKLLVAAKVNLNKQDKEGNTPLHKACSIGNGRVVEILLEAGADPKRTNHKKQIPLHLASSVNCVTALMGYIFDLNAQDQEGNTPLDKALLSEKIEVMKLMIQAGADFSQTELLSNKIPTLNDFEGVD